MSLWSSLKKIFSSKMNLGCGSPVRQWDNSKPVTFPAFEKLLAESKGPITFEQFRAALKDGGET